MAQKYKILFITSALNIRGRHSHLLALCKVLNQRGHLVKVVAHQGNMMTQFLRAQVKVYSLPLTGARWKDITHIYDLARILKGFADEDEIVEKKEIEKSPSADFFHIISEPLYWIGPWLSKITGVPYGLTVNQFVSGERSIPLGSKCMGVVAVSQALREFLINQMNLPNKLIQVIPNGVDIFRFRLPKYKPPNQPKIILSIGRYDPFYGMETLLEAYAKLLEKKHRFYLILMGEGSGEHELRELCRKKNLTHDVLFSHPRTDYERFLQLADIYVSPSQSEGMGQTILEAMACGLPLVATRVGGIFTAVQDHQTGLLVPKNDPQAMSEAIAEIAQDSDLAETLSKNARNLIQTNFNLAQMADAFEEFYEEKFRHRTQEDTRRQATFDGKFL